MTIETRLGAIIGTLCYMAPEQIRALATDARTDIFAFGCVMYEMLTGRRAFLGETAADTMTAILKEEPASVRPASSGVELDLERLIDRCLEKQPEQRFQTAADLAFSLRSIRQHTDHHALPARSVRRPLTAAVVVIVLMGAVFTLLWGLRRESRPGVHEVHQKIDSIAVLPLEDTAMSTSGDYERYFERDGVRHHHLIDPRTGRSPASVHSVTILAADGLTSEALSKSVFVLGLAEGMRLVEQQAGVDAIVVDAAGVLHFSSGLRHDTPPTRQ